MSIAIKKAQETGVGWVAANNSNHYGIAGMYSIQAVNQGLLVIVYCWILFGICELLNVNVYTNLRMYVL